MRIIEAIKRVLGVSNGVPKKDGSGRGVRANRGRGGCVNVRRVGRGK